jgi:hypothetical protein
MKKTLLIFFYVSIIACTTVYIPKSYSGSAYKTQTIPGKIECEFYDRGGEGVAYHDSDKINNGSGKLNPANGTYLNEFRMNEGVDISYTKSNNVDNNPYGKIMPVMDQLYVGWTVPGEWVNYSINVKRSGTYKIAVTYTSNGNGAISFDIDNNPATSEITIPSTHNDADTIAWRQWHHWNRIDSLTPVNIAKGKHLLTLHIARQGQMNFDYFEFHE